MSNQPNYISPEEYNQILMRLDGMIVEYRKNLERLQKARTRYREQQAKAQQVLEEIDLDIGLNYERIIGVLQHKRDLKKKVNDE